VAELQTFIGNGDEFALRIGGPRGFCKISDLSRPNYILLALSGSFNVGLYPLITHNWDFVFEIFVGRNAVEPKFFSKVKKFYNS
jgi:hypothetical protein